MHVLQPLVRTKRQRRMRNLGQKQHSDAGSLESPVFRKLHSFLPSCYKRNNLNLLDISLYITFLELWLFSLAERDKALKLRHCQCFLEHRILHSRERFFLLCNSVISQALDCHPVQPPYHFLKNRFLTCCCLFHFIQGWHNSSVAIQGTWGCGR